jgi:hypothetical protein
LRLQFSQPGLYLICHHRIEHVFHDSMPPLNESNQEPMAAVAAAAFAQDYNIFRDEE